MMQAQSYYRANKFLREDMITAELLSENLSDVFDDNFSNDDSVIIKRERKIGHSL
jgi:hypothetical protein